MLNKQFTSNKLNFDNFNIKEVVGELQRRLKINNKYKEEYMTQSLREVPEVLKKGVEQRLQDYYQLGWVAFDQDHKLVVTPDGGVAFMEASVLRGITLEEYAKKEIKKRQEKKNE